MTYLDPIIHLWESSLFTEDYVSKSRLMKLYAKLQLHEKILKELKGGTLGSRKDTTALLTMGKKVKIKEQEQKVKELREKFSRLKSELGVQK